MPNILVECLSLIASVRVGVLDVLNYLQIQGNCKIRFVETERITKRDIAWSDILISVRGSEEISFNIVKAAKEAGRFIVYFLDDDLWNVPIYTTVGEYYAQSEVKQNIIKIIQHSDTLWCVNALLLQKYSQWCSGKSILENVPVMLAIPQKETSANEENIHIVYAGSEDHTFTVRDIVVPALKMLLNHAQVPIHVTFIGVDPDIKGYKNVTYFPYFDDYDAYHNFMCQNNGQIGLAPVLTSEFYQCKYYNKYIEYTKYGMVGVYTNAMPYTQVVKNQINGFLCDNSVEDWYRAIKLAVENFQLREKCLAASTAHVCEEYSYAKVAEKLIFDLPEIATFEAPTIMPGAVRLQKRVFLSYWKKTQKLFKQSGLQAVPIIIAKAKNKLLKKT